MLSPKTNQKLVDNAVIVSQLFGVLSSQINKNTRVDTCNAIQYRFS